MNTRILFKAVLVCLYLLITARAALSGEINTGTAESELAIYGFDPVAYFTEHRAVEGNENIKHRWLGAQWNFSSEKHRQMFSENPTRYAPQYGGHCASGIAFGFAVPFVDPEAWRIIDGKLYLFADREVAIRFLESRGALKKSRNKWPKIQAKLLEQSD